MKVIRYLMVSAVVCASIFVAKTTKAQGSTLNNVPGKKSGAVVLVSNQQLLHLAKSLGVKVYTVKTLKSGLRKISSSSRKDCGCSLVQDQDLSSGCFTRCLQSWGISYRTVVACLGTCGGASTGNPIFIGICAACLGTGEWIVMGCSLSCVWRDGFAELMEVKARPSQNPRHRSVKTAPRMVKV